MPIFVVGEESFSNAAVAKIRVADMQRTMDWRARAGGEIGKVFLINWVCVSGSLSRSAVSLRCVSIQSEGDGCLKNSMQEERRSPNWFALSIACAISRCDARHGIAVMMQMISGAKTLNHNHAEIEIRGEATDRHAAKKKLTAMENGRY